MTLNKRYKRNIKQNLSFYICIIVLTALVASMYLSITGGVKNESDYIIDLNEKCKVEQAQFTVYNEMTDDDIEEYEQEYDMEIELQKQAELETDEEDTIRLLHTTKDINLYEVTQGEDISSDQDILLSTSYATTNGYEVGDEIQLEDKTYTVSGYFVRPDYLMVLEELSDNLSAPESFGIGIISDDAFDEIDEEEITSYYSVIFHEDNEREFRKELYDDFMTATYITDDTNLRISTATTQIEQYDASMNMILPLILGFVIIIVAVVLGRKIKSEQKYIGVLTAMGYQKKELARHYSVFGIVPGLIGSVIGILLWFPLTPVMAAEFFMKLEPLPIAYQFDVPKTVMILVLPAICYFIAVFLVALLVMRANVVDMVSGNTTKEGKSRFRMEKSRMKFRGKFILRSTFGKPTRIVILLLGMLISGILLVYCSVIVDSLRVYIDESVDRIGDFKYEYFLNTMESEEPASGAEILALSYEVKDSDDTFTMMGMDDNAYIQLEDNETGEIIEQKDDEYYITSMAAMMFDVSVGDTMTIYDIASLEEHEIEISGIVYNDSQPMIFTSQKTAAELMDLPDDSYYNAVVTNEELDYEDSEISKTVTKESFKEQIGMMEEMMGQVSMMLLPFAMLICIITIYLMVNVIVTENRPSISMLKVLGYRRKEINKIMTHVYTFFLPVGIVLGILGGFSVTKSTFDSNVAAYNTYIKTCIAPTSVVRVVVIIVISYLISLAILNRKVNKVNMVESLKDNRE
ncbi:MAG: ABC transporter permease [Eubacterium sp.]|nr:ABC transporter permease [Eubacterium sp.]